MQGFDSTRETGAPAAEHREELAEPTRFIWKNEGWYFKK